MSIPVFEIVEETDCSISVDELDRESARDLHELHGNHIKIEIPAFSQKDVYILRSKGYIGQIPLNNGKCLRINPKVPIVNVFSMLEYAYNLESFKLYEGQIDISVIEEIFEKLASILAKRVLNRARKGLYRDYIKEEDSLGFLRGRCLLIKTYANTMRGAMRIDCEFEKNTADLAENRILAWTLYQLPRFRSMHNDIRRQVNQAYRVVASVVDVRYVSPAECVGRFYHRLNEDYRPMHGLCRFFLEHCGPGMTTGEREFIPFLLHMPSLFETFVARWLEKYLPEGLLVEPQLKIDLDEEKKFTFRIDLVIRELTTGKVLAVLDTKYKRPDKPSNDDLNQIISYAVQMGTDNAILIYPSHNTASVNFLLGPKHKVRVRSLVFNIGSDLEDSGKRFLDSVLEITRERCT